LKEHESVGVSALITAVAASVARKGVPKWDANLFGRINDLSDGLLALAWAPMQAGALGAPLSVAAALAAGHRRTLAARVAANGVSAWLAAKAVKAIVDRPRPGQIIDSTRLRTGSADRGLGFPSGHAAVSIALARDLTLDSPTAVRICAYGLAFLAGTSRIYVGAHYPLDVVGGWALGWFIGDVRATVVRITN